MSKKTVVLFALNSSYSHTNSAVRLLKKYYESLFSTDTLEIKLMERNMGDRDLDIINELCSINADAYGFSVYIWNRIRMLDFARTVKSLLPHSFVFFGGPEISFEDESFFDENPYADSIIRGEGEKAFVRLCEDLLLDMPLEKLYDGEHLTSEEFELLGNPYSDETQSIAGKLVYLESVRGCPYSCSYCLSCNDKDIRAKSADATLRELEELRNSGINVVKFVDRTFNYDVKRCVQLLRCIIDANFPFCCHFEMCASLIDEDTLEVLKTAPPDKIRLECGVQSINPKTLKAINRPDTTEKTLAVIEKLSRIPAVTLHLDLIAGLPHETMETFAAAYNRLFGKCEMLQVGFLKLLHGTPMRKESEGYVYLHYPPYTVLQTPGMTREQLNILQDIAYLTDKYPNSGAFENTFEFFRITDPFAFMTELRSFILKCDNTQVLNKRLSRRDSFEYLFKFLSRTNDTKIVASCLRLDFLMNENIMPPLFLSPCESEKADKAAQDVAESFIKVRLGVKPSERGLVYVGRFSHLDNKLVICNRNNKELYVLDK
ncbi:MAG: DUF4080 domain-containing protein [Ruminococcaceae bacterium]|nr:DUF4080 domain-containing protein [Oscillospiraceae bacterium]